MWIKTELFLPVVFILKDTQWVCMPASCPGGGGAWVSRSHVCQSGLHSDALSAVIDPVEDSPKARQWHPWLVGRREDFGVITWHLRSRLSRRKDPFSQSGASPGAQQYRILQCGSHRRRGLDPWVRKIPWRRRWHPTPVSLPGESHGQRSLVAYSPWGRTESDVTEAT